MDNERPEHWIHLLAITDERN